MNVESACEVSAHTERQGSRFWGHHTTNDPEEGPGVRRVELGGTWATWRVMDEI